MPRLGRWSRRHRPAKTPPTAGPGGPYTIAEGGSLTLNASGSSDPDGDTLTYSWDINGDGTYGDATGASPTLTWAQLQALGINDGPASFNVTVEVGDGHGHVVTSSPVSLTVTNTAPTLTLSGNSNVSEGATYTLNFSDEDITGALNKSLTLTLIGAVTAATLDGDFNHDGFVDSADYTVWRDGLGGEYTASDYDLWKANFGQSLGSGSGGAGNTAAVPEPSVMLLAVAAFNCIVALRRRS